MPLTNLRILFSRVGVDITNGVLSIFGQKGPALVMFNDISIEGFIDGLIDVSDIAQIDVLTSTFNLAAFGDEGKNGVIAIYTKSGKINPPKDKLYVKKIMPLGFQTPVEFYAPKYDSIRVDSTPDLRTTIHWQPSLSTDEAGKASFRFYTADAPSTYSVVIEGVTDTGKIVYKREKIKVGVKR